MALPAAQPRERDKAGSVRASSLSRAAHQRMVKATAAEIAIYLQELFGQNLTALVSGIENPKTVGKWTRGQMPHAGTLTRMRHAFHVAMLLELGASRQTAQSWFMGMNPLLGDRAPALVLADEPEAAPRVMQAARAFLAHG